MNLKLFFIRSFTDPPEAVQIICECVLILFNVEEINWESAKTMMFDEHFQQKLFELDFDKITEKQAKAIQTQLKVSRNILRIHIS